MLPLADVSTFYLASPILLTALSAVLLGERVGAARWAATLVGFAGVLVALRPVTNGQAGWGLLATLVVCAAAGGGCYLAGLLAAWHLAGRPEGVEAALMRAAAGRGRAARGWMRAKG